jgi:ABC-type sugar transport system substrate-binding protein
MFRNRKSSIGALASVVTLGIVGVGWGGASASPTSATTEPASTTPEGGGGLICVIVPPVENPFFGAMQEIAANKAEELGYDTLRLVHDDDANRQLELVESCISQGHSRSFSTTPARTRP